LGRDPVTRFYASIALVALALMAAPRVEREISLGAVAASRAIDRASALAGDRWAAGETVGEIEVDVVSCIVTDIEEGISR
jgi:hypothetical protein